MKTYRVQKDYYYDIIFHVPDDVFWLEATSAYSIRNLSQAGPLWKVIRWATSDDDEYFCVSVNNKFFKYIKLINNKDLRVIPDNNDYEKEEKKDQMVKAN